MSEYIYSVAINGACGVRKHRIVKETPKTFVTDRIVNKVIRKETMRDNYCLYYLDEQKAHDFLRSIHKKQRRKAFTKEFFCAPGDTVYQICSGKILELEILHIRIYEKETRYVYEAIGSHHEYVTDADFENTVFSRKEDAEEALAKT